MKKKVVILWHNGGRLANQLWLFACVLAYCLEKGYKIENHCFFEYGRYFNFKSGNKLIDLFFYDSFNFFKKHLGKIWKDPYHLFFRRYYKLYAKTIENICRSRIIFASDAVRYLPPTPRANEAINKFDQSRAKKLYLDGWLFRNPEGLEKFRKEIVEYFKPRAEIQQKVDSFIEPLRKRFTHLVGVHVRQGDYKKEHLNGQLYFNEQEVNGLLCQHLQRCGKNAEDVCFVICSDGPVDTKEFAGLQTAQSNLGAIEDLFILASCDVVIGSDSTFGAWASYYGNIPFIVFERNGIDWDHYQGKEKFFFNPKCTTAHF